LRCASNCSPKARIFACCASVAAGKGNGSKQRDLLYRGSSPTPQSTSGCQRPLDVNHATQHTEIKRIFHSNRDSSMVWHNRTIKKSKEACLAVSGVTMYRFTPATACLNVFRGSPNNHHFSLRRGLRF
jgi:hypothetical protein